jgi:hypothetical protein
VGRSKWHVFSLVYCFEMSDISLVKSTESVPVPSQVDSLKITHDVGGFSANSTQVASYSEEEPKFLQKFTENSLDSFLTRSTLITSFTLSSTDTQSAVLNTYNFDPWNLFLSNAVIADKLSNYTYMRGTLQLIYLVTAPGAAYGRYVVSAYPSGAEPSGGVPVMDGVQFFNCMTVDHFVQIDIATSTSAVFQLPWIYESDVAKITDLRDNIVPWIMSIACLVPCRTSVADGISDTSVKVYASLMPDYKLVVPHFQVKQNQTLKDHARRLHDSIKGGQGSKIMGGLSDAMGKLSSVPVIGPFAEAASGVAKVGASVLSLFGFTRTTDETTPMAITQRSVTNVAHFDGGDASDVAALSIANSVSIDPTIGGFASEDCLAASAFTQRWGYIGSYEWTTGGSGDVLATIPICPLACNATFGLGFSTFSFTPVGYFGLPFAFWRGDMEFLIITPVSKLHRGALQVLWVPDGSSPTAEVTNSSLNHIYDVSEPQDHIFTVGFSRERPALNNLILRLDGVGIIPIGSANGALSIKVVNPLVAQTEAASTSIYVFARAGKNMQFGMPRDTILVPKATPSVFPLRTHTQLQADSDGALGDSLTVVPVVVPLVPSSGPYPSSEVLWGEDILSVRALLQKPNLLGMFSFGQTQGELIPRLLGPPATNLIGAVPVPWTWQNHYGCCYLGFACSERFKLFPREGSWAAANASHALSTAMQTENATAIGITAPLTFVGPNMGAEFTVPYYGDVKYRSGYYGTSVVVAADNTVLTCRGMGGSVDAMVYYSFGPDIRATCFRILPQVVFLDAEPASSAPAWFT